MTVPEYIALRKKSIEEYESVIRSQIKSSDVVSIMVVAAALEAFGSGFDCATTRVVTPVDNQRNNQ